MFHHRHKIKTEKSESKICKVLLISCIENAICFALLFLRELFFHPGGPAKWHDYAV